MKNLCFALRYLILLFVIELFFAHPNMLGQNISHIRAQIAAIYHEDQNLTIAQKRISSAVRAMVKKLEAKGITLENAQRLNASSLSNLLVKVDDSAYVQTYIHVIETNSDYINELREQQVRIEIVNNHWNIIQAWIPFTKIEDIAGLNFVKHIRPPGYGETNTGSVTSEGDAILRADEVRNTFGFDGSVIKVGLISDGVDTRSTAQATGDLPGVLEVDPDRPGRGDEGTAMLEIVHDLAPGAQLAFSSGIHSTLQMIEAIDYLANTAFGGRGADIIVDDLAFFTEPAFEEGMVAQKAEEVVASGVTYFTSAGNSGQSHYEHYYVDIVPGDDPNSINFHDFGTAAGAESDFTMSSLVVPSERMIVYLHWNDPIGGSENNYDLYLFDATGSNLLASSTNPQDGTQDPLEYAGFTNTTSSVVRVNVVINRKSGSTDKLLELFFSKGIFVEEYNVPEGSIAPSQQGADGVIAVGAIDVSDLGHDDAEDFSSRGPVRIFFPATEIRIKPDIAATDGNLITGAGGFGLEDPPGTFRFFGTSAASPHAAAVAALVLSSNPNLTSSEVGNVLKTAAVDLGEPGADNTFGAGRIDAFAAVQSVIDVEETYISINNVTVMEGDAGQVDAVFTARLSSSSDQQVTVEYATADCTAIAGSDYVFKSGILNFPIGTTTQTITVLVIGDTDFELNEIFFVNITNPTNATIADPQGVGTIHDDEIPPDISVSPTTLEANLSPDGMVTQTLTITNFGDGSMDFNMVDLETGTPSAASIAVKPGISKIKFTESREIRRGVEASTAECVIAQDNLSNSNTSFLHSFSAGLTPFTENYPSPSSASINQERATSTINSVVLVAAGGDPTAIQSELQAFIATVDIFDALAATPTLADLSVYDAAIVMNTTSFPDPVAMGDALADYVDAGGGVVITLVSMVTGAELAGRFITDGYSPFVAGPLFIGVDIRLGTFVANHPIMAEVTDAIAGAFADVALTSDAYLIAKWDNGSICVATKDYVVGYNGLVAGPGAWLGDVPLILAKAAAFSAANALWLSENPTSGTVPPNMSTDIDVMFEATGLAEGTYTADILITSNDPDENPIAVPVTLNVGEVTGLEITGNVEYCPTGGSVENVTMTLSGGVSESQLTNSSGVYQFENLTAGLDYTVTPSKAGDIGHLSISAYDAAQIARIAVCLNTAGHCDSLAGDVDCNGFIQAFDAALVARYAVGLDGPFAPINHTGEWCFEPASRSYASLNSDQTAQDYIATLLGDVNGDWSPATSAPGLARELVDAEDYGHLTDLVVSRGEIVSLPLMAEQGIGILSSDIDLEYNPKVLRFVEISKTELSEAFQVVSNAEEGRLRVCAYGTEPVMAGGEVFGLRFEVIGKEGDQSQLNLKCYRLNDGAILHTEVELNVGKATPEIPKEFALGRNYPNPFNPETRIRFDIPRIKGEQVTVRLSIYNISGQLVRVLFDEERPPGCYEILWDGRTEVGDLAPSGVYFYTMTAGNFKATRKMLVLK